VFISSKELEFCGSRQRRVQLLIGSDWAGQDSEQFNYGADHALSKLMVVRVLEWFTLGLSSSIKVPGLGFFFNDVSLFERG
jgi:hypothetical protein